MFHPLQVGSALHEDLGYERDDEGDHISGKNQSFCELTGLYWVWKNVQCDIVGICHYRRYFVYGGDLLRKNMIEEILENHDVIFSATVILSERSVRENYDTAHVSKDLDLLRQVLAEKYPDYLRAFDAELAGNTMASLNMLVMHKELYDAYCEWLFDILFEVEKRIDLAGYDDYQRRVIGFLAERLLLPYILTKGYRQYIAKVETTDLKLLCEAEEAARTKKSILKRLLDPLLKSYRIGKPTDLVDLCPRSLDFRGKLPVWVCWWQGERAMPEVVKVCYHSMKKNLPSDCTEIILITKENYREYVSFPDFVWEKFQKGLITLTHLSDLLRMALLTMYGGLWIDATYLMTESPDERVLFKENFYTQCFDELQYESRQIVVKGRWAGNLIRADAGNNLTRFVLNSFYYYWAVNETMLDYYLIDYLICIAYEEIPEIRCMIDECPPSQPDVFALERYINEEYDFDKWSSLTKQTSLFKLTYKGTFQKEVNGKRSFWGMIKEQNM